MNKFYKIFTFICIIGLICIFCSFVFSACNYQVVDLTYNYNYAWIDIPGGKVIEGKVSSWKDFENGDQLQVVIDGVTYLTDTTRCVLVKK